MQYSACTLSTLNLHVSPLSHISFSKRSKSSLIVVVLLILSGDVELNPGPASSTCISFSCLTIRSACSSTTKLNKPYLIQDFIHDYSLEILALTETWLS